MSHNYLDCIGGKELERLKSQHEAWLPETHAFLRKAGFPACQNIAEFGCGPGFTAIDLATDICPTSQITAFDISDYYLNHARRCIEANQVNNVEIVTCDVTQDIDFTNNFDAVFCRWFLAWVTDGIDTVLRNIHRSLKPQGVFTAMEYLTLRSTVYSPPCHALRKYLDAWEEFYIQAGGTTEVGSILPDKITRAGFKITDIQFVGGYSPRGGRLYVWWKRLYEDFRERFYEKGLLSDDDIDQLNAHWQQSEEQPDAFIFSPILVQITAEKT